MLIFLNVINPTNLTDLSDLISEFRETSTEKNPFETLPDSRQMAHPSVLIFLLQIRIHYHQGGSEID